MVVKYRQMENGDAPKLRELIVRTMDHSYREAYPPEAIAFFKAYHDTKNIIADATRGLTLVAVDGETIVGTGTLLETEIKRVFVDPRRQGQGMGGELMRRLISEARSQGLPSVTLDASLVSRSMYEHMGFRPVREARLDVGNGRTLDYTVMTMGL